MSLCVGKIIGAYGVHGQVKIKSFTSPPQNLIRYRHFFADQGRTHLSIQRHRLQNSNTLVATLTGITSREQAKTLCGTLLSIEREQLPPVTDADEFYYVDLIGLTCRSPQGQILGSVKDVFDFGAGPILEITDPTSSFLVSFTHHTVPWVDLKAQSLILFRPDEV